MNILNVKPNVVLSVHTAPGHSQKNEISPGAAGCTYKKDLLKPVKSVSCVIPLSYVNPVLNAPNVVSNLPVGARLQKFWKNWLDLGAGPKVVQILKEGYTLTFRIRPNLSRTPTVISCYGNPHRNLKLLEAVHQLMDKNAIELVHKKASLGFFNRLFLVPKPDNKWRPILDLSNLNLFLKSEKFKMETPETSIDFKDAYFHIPIQERSRKYLRFYIQGQTYQFKALPFGLSTAPMEFTVVAKEVKLMAIHKGIRIHQYLDDWLVRATSHQACLQHTQVLNVQTPGLAGECREVGAGTKTSFQLRRLPIRPRVRSGPTDTGPVVKPSGQDSDATFSTGLFGKGIYVLDRSTDGHRKTSAPGQTAHETDPVASQKQLENTGILGKMDPSAQISTPSFTMVAKRRQCPHRPTTTPYPTCSADLYRRIKRRVGRSLKRVHCQRNLVTTGKQTAYKLLGTKSSLSGSKRVPKAMHGQNGSDSNRQYHSSGLHQKGRRHEVGPTLCPTLENLDLVYREISDSEGPTHSRPPKCSGRQTVQIGTDYSNRMVPPSRSFSSPVQQVAPTSNRSLCHEIQQQVTPVCLTSSGPHGHCSGCTQFVMGRSGRIRLPTDSHIGQSGGKVTGLPIPEVDHHRPGLAQHDMVLGASGNVQPDTIAIASTSKPTDSTLQSDPSQESDKPKSPCMAPRATAIKEQGFSQAVATRIGAPQRGSTRSVYEAKWAIFTKWCITNQVDFRTPPVKSVADFLMYLFEERKLQPSTIDGYRSAIAETGKLNPQHQQR